MKMNVKKTEKDGIVRASIPKTASRSRRLHRPAYKLIEKDGLYFKDLEKTGELLPYEDWRLPVEERAADLAYRLTTGESAGLHSLLAAPGGAAHGILYVRRYILTAKSTAEANMSAYTLTDQQKEFMNKEHIRHVLMITVEQRRLPQSGTMSCKSLPKACRTASRVNISSDPRNGARQGSGSVEFKTAGSDVSKWPEGVGFAACFDPEVVRRFAEDASKEYRALGITTALGPQIDLCTEPRWMRFVDTLGENLEMTKKMVKAYCDGYADHQDSENGWGYDSVNTMVKRGRAAARVRPAAMHTMPTANTRFTRAIIPKNTGNRLRKRRSKYDGPTESASAVMPSVLHGFLGPRHQKRQKRRQLVQRAYLIKDLLREKYGFKGVVCTRTWA